MMRFQTQKRFCTPTLDWRQKSWILFLSLWCSYLVACGSGVQVGRIGRSTALSSGAPQNSCEQEKWFELAPARIVAQGTVNNVAHYTSYTQVYEGFGVFEIDSDDPEDIEDLWDDMNEPELETEHMKNITPVDDAFMSSLYWSLGGLIGMGAGVGTAAAIQKESGVAAAIVGVSGLVIGLVGVIGALAAQPSGPDQVYADARRKLFIPDEDDMEAVERGVDRINLNQRSNCGGKYSEPIGAIKPVTKPASTDLDGKSAPLTPSLDKKETEDSTEHDGATLTEDATTDSSPEPTTDQSAIVPEQESPETTEQ